MPAPVISVENVGVRFQRDRRRKRSLKDMLSGAAPRHAPDEFWAFRGVSFDVAQGESIGVVGRNGQGKSTLLKMVAEVLIPDEGSVAVRQGVAPLIEITGGFVDELSVRDNVFLASGLHPKNNLSLAPLTALQRCPAARTSPYCLQRRTTSLMRALKLSRRDVGSA